MAELGQRLIDLHFLKPDAIQNRIAKVRYQGSGHHIVEKILYDESNKQVWINEEQYFENISPEMWNYQIGGYQVLEKYLKDRKEKKLIDYKRYIEIAEAIAWTIKIQEELDLLYEKVEEDTISFE